MSLPMILKISYSVMTIIVLSLMWFYAHRLASGKAWPVKFTVPFYGWIGFLVVVAVSLHLLTAWQLPWVHWEFNKANIKPDKEVVVGIKDNQFKLPEEGINIKEGEIVKFKVLSDDLTYGFGVFNEDGAMSFQMQVTPGHSNETIWIFSKGGKYSIRCTEYAGPDTWKMVMRDAIEVSPDLSGASKVAKLRSRTFVD